MPWCPNCKAEYQEGYTECSDCGVALVESLEEEIFLAPFFQAEDKKIADKLASFFQYSNMPASVTFDKENELYIVNIPPRAEKEARKLYQAFYFVERDNIAKGLYADDKNEDESGTEASEASEELLSEEEAVDEVSTVDQSSEGSEEGPEIELFDEEFNEDELYEEESEVYTPKAKPEKVKIADEADTDIEPEEDTHSYVMKADKYKDLAGTVWIFLFFGIVGLGFVLLNVFGLLSVLNGWLPNTIMGVLFLFFLYVGISTNQKAKKLRSEISAENEMSEKINAWFKEHFTEEFIASLYNNTISEELNYIKLTDTIKEMLLKEFGPQNLAYLDRLIEDYYNNNFDQVVL